MDIKPEIKAFLTRNAVTTLSHPLEYCKTLMQLGYEPFVPTESTSLLFRKKYWSLPNAFTYVKYLKSVDGFLGLYRGLLPRLIESNVHYWVFVKMADVFPEISEDSKIEDEDGDDNYRKVQRARVNWGFPNLVKRIPEDVFQFLKSTGINVVKQWIATTVSYPFHVIAVRSMAQFVGRETTYDNIINGIREIYQLEGVLGLFKGLLPRLFYDTITVVVTGACIFLIHKYVTQEGSYGSVLLGGVVANSVAYPYLLVSNVYAVNGSGLALGQAPHTAKVFSTWYDCWTTLRSKSELNRGSAMYSRHFIGNPSRIGKDWIPGDQYFGPIHPPAGLGTSVLYKYPKTHLT